ncbi:3D domain-containing protein [Thermoanaerobacter kivui]|uniref:3D domain-containing protein n=1 Tax=Thermoanaerobacter kivui TaxID=2325 RepID=A0A097ANC7_THEKI|nr:ubiquitin-like domain-containing protein [Thermoanaerobacter kivui]AIS51319.1 3D domain-containing protein [Thermoanaerobacter kivui]
MNTDKFRKRLGEMVKKPVALLTLAAVFLLVVSLGAYASLKKEVTIQDDNRKIVVTTLKYTVKDLLEEKNIKLRKEDVVSPSLDAVLKNGMKVTIKRAVPVTLCVDGKTKEIYTAASNIKDVLTQNGITLGPKDKVNMALDTSVFKYMYIDVTKVTEKIITQEVDIPYQTETVKNDNMERGQVKVVQQGEMGKKQVVMKITYENGKEVARNVIEEKIIKNPINKMVQVGTLGILTTSRGETFRYREVRMMIATAYDSSEDSTGKKPSDPDYGITATGIKATRGVIAVDPRVIPFGTRMYVEGYGFGIAADTGGAIKGNIIDVYFPTHEEVQKWGRRYVKVYILK